MFHLRCSNTIHELEPSGNPETNTYSTVRLFIQVVKNRKLLATTEYNTFCHCCNNTVLCIGFFIPYCMLDRTLVHVCSISNHIKYSNVMKCSSSFEIKIRESQVLQRYVRVTFRFVNLMNSIEDLRFNEKQFYYLVWSREK